MERRIPLADREILPGITLKVSTMGGYSVHVGTGYVGWINAAGDGLFNAYVRVPGHSGGSWLGKYAGEAESARQVVSAHQNTCVATNRRVA
ncbi:hypothetical protein QLQ12_12120 [Actinoplanes sp. NEAU-A12]|uniref:Uncharacterized protein n=1 Tax=Actinoplanes sandaracinus TaxID=3045177 RepID=A0ABT6WHX6_9ACTN|nr:hypothetical protein [Actinoplanes sandaracinus]MDI6099338.1 hypothetical protein [Actinoplanes sandaracinus]